MKILFLGVSPALAAGQGIFQSNMLIESKSGLKLLIDCGSDIKNSLHAQSYTHCDIDGVYISHLHSDHIGGLEWLAFCKYFIEKKKPKLYISGDQREALWTHALSAGMSTLENEQAQLSTYFDVQPITHHEFVWENYSFHLIKTYHTISNQKMLPSYGLLISTGLHKIFISTDARFSPDILERVYKEADVIFHDCETYPTPSQQHAHYEDLKTLDPSIKSKMWLYNYDEQQKPDAQKEGFKGCVVAGQSFSFAEKS